MIGPKWLVPCSPPVLADGYEFELTSRHKKRKREQRTHTDTYDNTEKLDGDDLINMTRLLKRQKRQLEAIKQLNEACGHRSVK